MPSISPIKAQPFERFAKRVAGSTPGGGCNPDLAKVFKIALDNCLGSDRSSPDVPTITALSRSLARIAKLAQAAADVAGDPDFIAANADVLAEDYTTRLGVHSQ